MLEFANAYLTAARMGTGLLQGYFDQKAVDQTIKRQERNAKLRAANRHAKLREVLSSQRVNLANQGRTGATSAMLAAKSVQEAAADTAVDAMEVGDYLSDLRTKAKSAWIGRISDTAQIGLKSLEGEREKKLLKKKDK